MGEDGFERLDSVEPRMRELMMLSTDLLREAHKGPTRVSYLQYASRSLMAFTGCDRLEVRLAHGAMKYRWRVSADSIQDYDFRCTLNTPGMHGFPISQEEAESDFERLCDAVLTGTGDLADEAFARSGHFWSADTRTPVVLHTRVAAGSQPEELRLEIDYGSIFIVRLAAEGENVGLLVLQKREPHFWDSSDCAILRYVGDVLGVSTTDRRAQAALRERIKELTCLYGVALAMTRGADQVEGILNEIVEILPPSWQFPEIACARIALDGATIRTRRFGEMKHSQRAEIMVRGSSRGVVEVGYFGDRPEFAEGPFLAEEQSLLEAVAQQIALLAERREDDQERSRLKAQLRHADRLATIGQLSAGVAHELNEPLSNILGYAQLALKCPEVPQQAVHDIEKIAKASLHAREVIRKLMLYARQTPPQTQSLDLNRLVEDGLDVFAARCKNSGIRLTTKLAPDLPRVTADAAQLNQVLVNLVVNAMQAMPDGGTLTVETRRADGGILLAVEDTGTGMPDEVLGKIFLPFFTTKDVNEGTGLGLAVVQGIVTAHGGTITAASKLHEGSRFEVKLPLNHVSESLPGDAHES